MEGFAGPGRPRPDLTLDRQAEKTHSWRLTNFSGLQYSVQWMKGSFSLAFSSCLSMPGHQGHQGSNRWSRIVQRTFLSALANSGARRRPEWKLLTRHCHASSRLGAWIYKIRVAMDFVH